MRISFSDPDNMSMDNLESLKIMKSSFDTTKELTESEKENNQSENMVQLGDTEEKKDEL